MQLLQRQVREMRYSMSQKDKALARAAKILAEYSVALKEAEFDAFKRTIEHGGAVQVAAAAAAMPQAPVGGEGGEGGDDERSTHSHNNTHAAHSSLARPKVPTLAEFIGGKASNKKGGKGGNRLETKSEVVEVMKRTANMDSALKRLYELLLPFEEKITNVVIEEEGAEAMMERERHISQLHRRVNNLKGSLDRTEEVAIIKVKKSLSENQVLVEEVNSLRHRLSTVTKENQRQKASINMMRLKLDQNNPGGDGRGGDGGAYDMNDSDVDLEDSHSEQRSQNRSPDMRSHSHSYSKGNQGRATHSTSIAFPGAPSV